MSIVHRTIVPLWNWYRESLIVGLRPKTPSARKYRVRNLVKNGYTEDTAWEVVLSRDYLQGCREWSQEEIEQATVLVRKNRRQIQLLEQLAEEL